MIFAAKPSPSIHTVILQGDILRAQDMIEKDEKLLKKTDDVSMR